MAENVRTCDGRMIRAMEVRYWRFQPMLFFMVPFMCVWTYMSVGKMYVEPFLEGFADSAGRKAHVFWCRCKSRFIRRMISAND